MTVFKRRNSYWINVCFNRKRYRKKSPDNTYKGARNYELFLRQKLAKGETLEESKKEVTSNCYFKEIAVQWFNVYVQNNNKHSERLNRKYVLNSTLIPYFGAIRVNDINSFKVEQFKSYLINNRELSPKSINNYLCILSRCLKSCEEWGIINKLPKIKLLKVPPQKYDFLTDEETETLLQNAKGMWHDMILLAIQTGLRFGELIALRWGDINIKEGFVTVNRNIVRDIECSPKNNKTRVIPLTTKVIQMLQNRDKKYQYIFHDNKGSPLKDDFCRDNLHLLCKTAGLRQIGWHCLRHSFASHLAARRNSIVAIKELLGHSDIKTTMRYAHVNLPVLKNAIETLEPGFKEVVTILSQNQNRVLESEAFPSPKL